MTTRQKDWRKALIRPDKTALMALEVLENCGLQIVLVVNNDMRLLGVVTDGDIRRLLLRGGAMTTPVSEIMNTTPVVSQADEGGDVALSKMRKHNLHHIPMLDDKGRLVHLVTMDDLLTAPQRDNLVVLMAGGLGTRLSPLTEICPKPMLKVGGRPILETILIQFLEYGFSRFAISVNYMANAITSYFDDGSKWGAEITYVHEQKPLGTAGALSLLTDRPTQPFFLMNGDLLTKLNFSSLLSFHEDRGAPLTMCVREHAYSVPYGVAEVNGEYLAGLQEKPTYRKLVNAGIYVCDPETIDFVPSGQSFDMTDMVDALIAKNHPPAVFPIHEYWVDVGQHRDFDQAHEDFDTIFG